MFPQFYPGYPLKLRRGGSVDALDVFLDPQPDVYGPGIGGIQHLIAADAGLGQFIGKVIDVLAQERERIQLFVEGYDLEVLFVGFVGRNAGEVGYQRLEVVYPVVVAHLGGGFSLGGHRRILGL